jgi:hypothetical protein
MFHLTAREDRVSPDHLASLLNPKPAEPCARNSAVASAFVCLRAKTGSSAGAITGENAVV